MRSTPAGVVLTGGRSRRMGADKAFVVVDGRPMVVRVAAALADGGCEPVECQGGDLERLVALGLTGAPDATSGHGPVAAIADALGRLGGPLVVAACDLPALDGDAVRAVTDAGCGAAMPAVAVADGRAHLLSYWPADALDALRALLAGDRSPSYRHVVRALGAVEVAVDPSAMRNINRPDDV